MGDPDHTPDHRIFFLTKGVRKSLAIVNRFFPGALIRKKRGRAITPDLSRGTIAGGRAGFLGRYLPAKNKY